MHLLRSRQGIKATNHRRVHHHSPYPFGINASRIKLPVGWGVRLPGQVNGRALKSGSQIHHHVPIGALLTTLDP